MVKKKAEKNKIEIKGEVVEKEQRSTDVVADVLLVVSKAVQQLTASRDKEKTEALNRAGGNIYKIENFGFNPRKYEILLKLEAFLNSLKANGQ